MAIQQTAYPALQKAVYQRLAQDEALSAEVTGVYDYIPTGTDMPYIALTNFDMDPFDTRNDFGEEFTFEVQVWSGYSGNAEVYRILNLALAAFTKRKMKLDEGFAMASFRRERMRPIPEPDNAARRGSLRMRAFIMQK